MLRILLVDDERTEREGIRFLIDKFNLPLKVAEAPNGKKALEYIRELYFSYLIINSWVWNENRRFLGNNCIFLRHPNPIWQKISYVSYRKPT